MPATLLDDRYELMDPLGFGGMAVVWRARDHVLGRLVAVKLLAGRLLGQPGARDRIRDEARAAAALAHPNIAQVYDYGEWEIDGKLLPYVVMELVRGTTLEQRIQAGPMSARFAMRTSAEVAAALAAAHAEGLAHRDVKPANVMVTTQGVKVVDFGIAAAISPGGSGKPDLEVLGTPAYLAPERLTDDAVEPASDVYALGVLLFRLLSGGSPWTADTTTEMLKAHISVEPVPLSPLPEVPGYVIDLCNRCLSKDPTRRPSAREAAALLARGAGIRVVTDDEPAPVQAGRTKEPSVLIRRPGAGPAPAALTGFPAVAISPGSPAGSTPSGIYGAVASSGLATVTASSDDYAGWTSPARPATPTSPISPAGSTPPISPAGSTAPRTPAAGPTSPAAATPPDSPAASPTSPAGSGSPDSPPVATMPGFRTGRYLTAPAEPASETRSPWPAEGLTPAPAEEPTVAGRHHRATPVGSPDRLPRRWWVLATAVIGAVLAGLFVLIPDDPADPGKAIADSPHGAVSSAGAGPATQPSITSPGDVTSPAPGTTSPPAGRRAAANGTLPPSTVATSASTGPSSSATPSRTPPPAPPPPPPTTTAAPEPSARTLTSDGGTVRAICPSPTTAKLLSWSATKPYRVGEVKAGPASEAVVIFMRGSEGVQMVITCSSGVPSTSNSEL
ncbi:MAG TPA: protein kinase [Actinoplanes sp.]|nr:protein kinase [Actinoplanes sp.]